MSARARLLVGCTVAMFIASACFAPKPHVVGEQLHAPAQPGQPWQLAVTVQNGGGGEGAAEITTRLFDAKGNVVGEASRDIDLQPHETITVSLDLTPSSAGPYHTKSEVMSPPE